MNKLKASSALIHGSFSVSHPDLQRMAQQLTHCTQRPSGFSPESTVMQAIILFLRRLIGPPTAQLIDALHIRLLNDWLITPDPTFIHPHCVWILNNGHPHQGVYEGQYVYDHYTCYLADSYSAWHQVVNEVIGSASGGIVTGEYQFRHTASGLWHAAPFSHFYRIHQGKIVGVRFYMGDVRMQLPSVQSTNDLVSLTSFCSLN
ncbi:nuclear transport factor 2 family protein [Spirosoma spitsbergense]|uniref:nuclear transport factor 2 family protein n=1 Tax=Spirosoma spitsbergense TaxID=431554 RepID=UPI001FE0AE96|nr:nuclear transport factor 2 family protein [Spirosoma spitsbergense]